MLHMLHTRGMMHCDFKPDQLGFDLKGNAKLVDLDTVFPYSPKRKSLFGGRRCKVCVCVCACACVCACVYVCAHACAECWFALAGLHTHRRARARTHTQRGRWICPSLTLSPSCCTHTALCTPLRALRQYIYTYIYIYIYIYI